MLIFFLNFNFIPVNIKDSARSKIAPNSYIAQTVAIPLEQSYRLTRRKGHLCDVTKIPEHRIPERTMKIALLHTLPSNHGKCTNVVWVTDW